MKTIYDSLKGSALMEQNILDTNAGKQLPLAATDFYLILVLKK
jgi:hypothetical protein